MPAAKNTYLRYRILNTCFTSKVKMYWSKKELVDKLSEQDIIVNARTLDYDIESMRHDSRLGYLAPIAYCKRNKGFYYKEPGYSIDKLPLSNEELKALTFALATLRQYKGMKLVSDFEGAVDKIIKVVDYFKSPQVDALPIIEFEKVPYYKGIEFIDSLLEAIQQQTVIRITYTKFSCRTASIHHLHPYFLKEYKNRWYVLGYSEEKEMIITLALDRIDSLHTTTRTYRTNALFHPHHRYHNTLGITLATGKVESVRLHCSPLLGQYMKTQHLHHSQQVIHEDDKGIVIELKLIPNYELLSLILSYGSDMQVLQPQSLHDQVKNNILQSANFYNR